MKRLLVLVIVVAGLALGACAPVKVAGPTACPPPSAQELVDVVNADRAANGLAPVVLDAQLAAKAQGWAEHMAATNTPAHNGNTDNIVGRWPCSTATELEAAWMASPDHRTTIMKPWLTKLGLGSTVNGAGLWAVQQFG